MLVISAVMLLLVFGAPLLLWRAAKKRKRYDDYEWLVQLLLAHPSYETPRERRLTVIQGGRK